MNVAGAVLCGGAGRRFSGPKGLEPLGSKSLIRHVVDRLTPQVQSLVICAGQNAADYRDLNLPLAADALEGRAGPASGLLAAMTWAGQQGGIDWVLTAPCDMPFLPADLLARLMSTAQAGHPCYAVSPAGNHYTLALWPVGLLTGLQEIVVAQGERALHRLLTKLDAVPCPMDGTDAFAFFNINTPADHDAAERRLKRLETSDG